MPNHSLNSYTIGLLEEVAEYLEPEMDADGTPDGYRPNLAMQLYTAVEQEIERLKAPAADYAKRNPLGGPAKVFEAMAARIRSGEEFYSVLDDYGFAVKPSTTMPDMSTPDKWERLRAGIAHKQQSGPTCPAKDQSQDFPCRCGARFIDECTDSHSVNAMKGGDGGKT